MPREWDLASVVYKKMWFIWLLGICYLSNIGNRWLLLHQLALQVKQNNILPMCTVLCLSLFDGFDHYVHHDDAIMFTLACICPENMNAVQNNLRGTWTFSVIEKSPFHYQLTAYPQMFEQVRYVLLYST